MTAPAQKPTAILLISCPDRQGIIAALAGFITAHRGNIIALDQYVDHAEETFFARIEWEIDSFAIPYDGIPAAFRPLADQYDIQWSLHRSDRRLRMGLMFSKQPHCLYDVLSRTDSGEWPVDIALAISNHPDHRDLIERRGIPFKLIPVTAADKHETEPAQIEAMKEAGVDFIVLARYMQILSPAFVEAWPMRIINIHHSFLPAFAGAKPYHAAHDRGVKIIGATAHYVTEHLDEGPIIEQDVQRVSHRQGVSDLIRLGRDLEKIVLARAVYWHLQHRILPYKNRTVVFS